MRILCHSASSLARLQSIFDRRKKHQMMPASISAPPYSSVKRTWRNKNTRPKAEFSIQRRSFPSKGGVSPLRAVQCLPWRRWGNWNRQRPLAGGRDAENADDEDWTASVKARDTTLLSKTEATWSFGIEGEPVEASVQLSFNVFHSTWSIFNLLEWSMEFLNSCSSLWSGVVFFSHMLKGPTCGAHSPTWWQQVCRPKTFLHTHKWKGRKVDFAIIVRKQFTKTLTKLDKDNEVHKVNSMSRKSADQG